MHVSAREVDDACDRALASPNQRSVRRATPGERSLPPPGGFSVSHAERAYEPAELGLPRSTHQSAPARGVEGHRAGESVAEIASHLEETGVDAVEEFGTPFDLAENPRSSECLLDLGS